MNNAINNIRKGLLKRQEVIIRHKERKEAFLKTRERITKDIAEAGIIWKNTMDALPKSEF